MNRDEDAAVTLDDRLRAALLWDRPGLSRHEDSGTRQWRAALELEFVSFGNLDVADVLSLAAHAVRATALVEGARAAELREELRSAGAVGELFEWLIGLSMSDDPLEQKVAALHAARPLLGRLADTDLRARLLVRLLNFAQFLDASDVVPSMAEQAVELTSPDTRLGVVARRWASRYGQEITGFNPYARTDTPDDALLTLPWVQRTVIDSVSSMATDRLARRLASVWDSSFHVGRTKFDDLLAAQAQAEWCGALDLRSQIRRLLATELLSDRRHPTVEIRWAIEAWVTEPGAKRVTAAVRSVEQDLDAESAAALWQSVRADTRLDDDAVVDVALGLWDLLDDDVADDLLRWLVVADVRRSEARRDNGVNALLWRRPATWAETFVQGDEEVRARMFAALDPHDLEAADEQLRAHLIAYTGDDVESVLAGVGEPATDALRLALAYLAGDAPIQIRVLGSVAVELLDWQPTALAPESIRATLNDLVASARDRLGKASEGTYGMGMHDTGQLLGRLASRLPRPDAAAVEVLFATCQHPSVPARWQFGALEGFNAMRRAGLLRDDDLRRIGELEIAPGREVLGEHMSAEALRAAQLRVAGAIGDDEDIAWLAVCSRGSDVQARLIAMHALTEMPETGAATVDWSLVGGLFDPQDDVVSAAVGALGRRGLHSGGGPTAVAQSRLRRLAETGSVAVRRAVIVVAQQREELALSDVLTRALLDRSWMVRREAQPEGREAR